MLRFCELKQKLKKFFQKMTPEIKQKIITYAQSCDSERRADIIEEWHERAAIIEFDGECDRKTAEAIAWESFALSVGII